LEIKEQMKSQREAFDNLEKVMKDNLNVNLRVVKPFVRLIESSLHRIKQNFPEQDENMIQRVKLDPAFDQDLQSLETVIQEKENLEQSEY